MSQGIEKQLLCLIKKSPWFDLQCDKSKDVAHCCQLLISVQFLSGDDTIKGGLLLSQINYFKFDYFEKHKVMWEYLVGFSTNGDPAMHG